MRKIILLDHVTLDGFIAGPAGEMNWIKLSDDMFDLVHTISQDADAALYGRVTYDMMNSYWPEAGEQPNASKHDKQHSAWYNAAQKIVISKTLQHTDTDKTLFVGEDIPGRIAAIKEGEGANILMLGSASAAHVLIQHDLVDEYWLFVNPVILGKGLPLFKDVHTPNNLERLEVIAFDCGVTGMHFAVKR